MKWLGVVVNKYPSKCRSMFPGRHITHADTMTFVTFLLLFYFIYLAHSSDLCLGFPDSSDMDVLRCDDKFGLACWSQARDKSLKRWFGFSTLNLKALKLVQLQTHPASKTYTQKWPVSHHKEYRATAYRKKKKKTHYR